MQNVKPSPAAPSAGNMEAHKNALVQDMLAKIKPYVDAKGIIILDADGCIPKGFLDLLQKEHAPVPKVLLTTIMLNAAHAENQVWSVMSLNMDLVNLLQAWFKEAVTDLSSKKSPPLLLNKLVDLLAKLPFTLDTLTACKLGRPLKKLLGIVDSSDYNSEEPIYTQLKKKTHDLFNKWSTMADDSEVVVAGDTVDAVKVDDSIVDKKEAPVMEEVESVSKNQPVQTTKEAKVKRKKSEPVEVPPIILPEQQQQQQSATQKAIDVVPIGRASSYINNANNGHSNGSGIQQQQLHIVNGSNSVNPNSHSSVLPSRPLSADDIQREKKKKAYLESIGVVAPSVLTEPTPDHHIGAEEAHTKHEEDVIFEEAQKADLPPGLSLHPKVDDDQTVEESIQAETIAYTPMVDNPPEPVNKKIKKDRRRVSFPDDPEALVQVRYFEPSREEEINAGAADQAGRSHTSTINEAGYAFDKLREVMEADIPWRSPSPYNAQHVRVAYEGCFKREQDIREQSILNVSYPTASMIPKAPSEVPNLAASAVSLMNPVNIPLTDAQRRPPVRKTIPQKTMDPPAVSPEMLSALLQNISSILPVQPMSTGGAPNVPPPPPASNPNTNQQQLKYAHQSQKTKSHGVMRPLCKFYKQGVPGSCRSGTKCPFRHA